MKFAFCFQSVHSLISFQNIYEYNFLLSIFLLELCWDAKKHFFKPKILKFYVAVYSRVPKH